MQQLIARNRRSARRVAGVFRAAFLFGFVQGLLVGSLQVAVRADEPPRADVASSTEATIDEHGYRIHRVESEFQRGPTEIKVMLPDVIEPGQRYRVLYVLPVVEGDTGQYGHGLEEVRRHDLHNKYHLICVFPTFSAMPWYADHPTDPAIRQESYLLETVLPLVEREYPVIAAPEGRLLLGFSKSGWGAFALLLRHPDLFGRAVAWDAPFDWDQPNRAHAVDVFGTQENFERYHIKTLLREHAGELGGETRLFNFGAGGKRFEAHESVHRLMDELGIAHRYQNGPEREHNWESGWVPEAVEFLAGPESSEPPAAGK